MGAEQKQTFKKSHIKQLSLHFVFIVENMADKKKPSAPRFLSYSPPCLSLLVPFLPEEQQCEGQAVAPRCAAGKLQTFCHFMNGSKAQACALTCKNVKMQRSGTKINNSLCS